MAVAVRTANAENGARRYWLKALGRTHLVAVSKVYPEALNGRFCSFHLISVMSHYDGNLDFQSRVACIHLGLKAPVPLSFLAALIPGRDEVEKVVLSDEGIGVLSVETWTELLAVVPGGGSGF